LRRVTPQRYHPGMSYTKINGMRSARYPLQGGDCGCGGPCCGSMGDANAGTKIGASTVLLVAGGLFVALRLLRNGS
jgi:hypothetical protein